MQRCFGLLVLMILLGCSVGSTAPEFSEVVYHLSGGIAGYNRQIAIAADGSFQVTDKGQPFVRGTLPDRTMKQLQAAMGDVSWVGVAPRYTDPRVADAIYEAITVKVGTKAYTVVVGTGSSPPRPVAVLASVLKQILADHTLG